MADVSITKLLAWFFAAAILVTGAISWATGDTGPVFGFTIAGALMVPSAALADHALNDGADHGD